MPVDQRLCESCNVVEDECHVIMHLLYDDIRTQLFIEINNISDQFPMLSTDVQFLQITSNPQYYRSASRAMHNILNRRRLTTVQVTTTSFSGEVILYYLSNIIYTKGIVLIAMYNYIA